MYYISGMRKLTQEEVIKRFKEKHGDRYDYSLVEYNGANVNVKIKCNEHGEFNQMPYNHFMGKGCSKCIQSKKTTNDFILDSKAVHGDIYDYSLVEYVNSKTKVKIICRKDNHGIFEQTPNSHLNGKGCFRCFGIKKQNTYEFIKKSIYTHGDKYDYSLVKYVNSRTIVKIICPIHSVFEQTPYNHILSMGCPKCGVLRANNHNRKHPMGWTCFSWSKSAERSNVFDSFKVYIIRCWNDDEEFYKIGRTFQKTSRRFSGYRLMPYQHEIIKEIIFDKHTEIIDNAREAFNKETNLKMLNKKYKYVPKIKFNGMYECFHKIDIRD